MITYRREELSISGVQQKFTGSDGTNPEFLDSAHFLFIVQIAFVNKSRKTEDLKYLKQILHSAFQEY